LHDNARVNQSIQDNFMSKSDSRQILVVSCSIFLMLGMFTAAIGPILPEFSANTHASLTAVGGIITAIFLGALVSQLLGGPVIDR
jgi:MFS family permease